MINIHIIKEELKGKFNKEKLTYDNKEVLTFLEQKGIRTMYLKYRVIEMSW